MRAVGPDVNHHHPIVDIERLLDTGVSFIGMKVSQGASYVDPWFARHLQLARDAGDRLAAVLLYHFADPTGDPVQQARRFLSLVGTPVPGDVLVLDVEERRLGNDSVLPPPPIAWVDAFYAELPAGVRLACYVSPRIWRQMGNPGWPRAGAVGLWVPRYPDVASDLPEGPPVPPPWQAWDFWQYSEGDTFPGVEGPADGNFFRGDQSELRVWARP